MLSAASMLLLLFSVAEKTDPVVETGPYPLIYPQNFGNRLYIPADNSTTKEGVYLGRLLFYEPALSANNKISCGSCHQQKRAFTDGLPFSEGINGQHADRNAMSLVNLAWSTYFFWDGRVKGLEQQVTVPINHPHEMGQSSQACIEKLRAIKSYPPLFRLVFGNDSITALRIAKAIAQFERTLISANAPYDKYLRGDYALTTAEQNGMDLFMRAPDPKNNIRGANCGRCHGTPKMFIELFHNNGLDSLPADIGREKLTGDPMDRGRFKVPSLRNIALTAPYMHDGRFKTLEEVLDHYSDHIINTPALSPLLQNISNNFNGRELSLNEQEKKDIILFLRTLTDTDFITDKRFADPHKN